MGFYRFSSKFIGIHVFILSFLAVPALSGADVWYVDGDLSVSGSGTSWVDAFKTIYRFSHGV